MKTMLKLVGAMALTVGATGAVSAQDALVRTADHNGASELARGDYAKAGRVLAAAQRVSPDATDVLLNLAQVNLRSGRADAARDLYRQVLAGPDDQMLLARGEWASAHTLARVGLQATTANLVVAR